MYLYEELKKYCDTDAYPFHMPGHKRRVCQFSDPYKWDITEIDGFDNLHHAEGILRAAEQRAAALYQSEETHFLVNGSTAGILAAIGAATRRGGTILMARSSHKAAYHAVEVNDLRVKYLMPRGGATEDQKAAALKGSDPSEKAEVFVPDQKGAALKGSDPLGKPEEFVPDQKGSDPSGKREVFVPADQKGAALKGSDPSEKPEVFVPDQKGSDPSGKREVFVPAEYGENGGPIDPEEVERALEGAELKGSALKGSDPSEKPEEFVPADKEGSDPSGKREVFVPAEYGENDQKGSDPSAGSGGSRIQAVYITSPTYDGVISDVKTIAEICHRHNVPLIVDEAHGAHFGFGKMFPPSSVSLGADYVIHSVHKTLPSLTQTALIHISGPLADRRRLREMLDIYQTSSPSYVLMASIDNCIRIISQDGPELFKSFEENLRNFYRSVEDLRHIHFIVTDDPSKILVKPDEGMSAKELYDVLRLRYRLQPEMLSRSYVLMLSSVGDDQEGFRRLSEALHEIDKDMERKLEENPAAGTEQEAKRAEHSAESMEQAAESAGQEAESAGQEAESAGQEAESAGQEAESAGQEAESAEHQRKLSYTLPKAAMRIGQAQDAQQEKVEFEKSAGRISGEYLYLYPPGIPLITPGEIISGKLIRQVKNLEKDGYQIEGADDYSLKKIWCIAGEKKS